MDKFQIAHDLACAALPIAYDQYIKNGGDHTKYDIAADYKSLFLSFMDSEQLNDVSEFTSKK